jgi:hypothetical protein
MDFTLIENQLDVDALAGVEILIPNGDMSPNKHGSSNGSAQVPSISYTSVQSLGVGDPISHVSCFSFELQTCFSCEKSANNNLI